MADINGTSEQLVNKQSGNNSALMFKDGFKIEWTSETVGEGDDAEQTGRHFVTVSGTTKFEIVESVVEEGENTGAIVYQSAMLKVAQDDFKSAINVSLKNAIGRAFTKKWDELFPPVTRERAKRETLSDKLSKSEEQNAKMQLALTEIVNATSEGRPINIQWLIEQGVDLEAVGLGAFLPK